MADSEHPRLILNHFLSPDLCKELEFIHKSCSTIGYRENVFSTTLSHLIATNSPHLILPFIPIREKLKEKVEEFFGCEYELFIEFTGLIRFVGPVLDLRIQHSGFGLKHEFGQHSSWSKGASIGWHSDDNRPYLKQRDYAAVCYLNSHGVDFGGGLFHFQDGEPKTFIPMAGDVLIYTADSRNVHSVEEITNGERLTLTLWFSRDKSHDEDSKLISFLTKCPFNCSDPSPNDYLPLPASQNMYWFPPEQSSTHQSGFDIRFARLHVLGYKPYPKDAKKIHPQIYPTCYLNRYMWYEETSCLTRNSPTYHIYFRYINHFKHQKLMLELFGLTDLFQEVVQFYHWKAPELQRSEFKREPIKVVPISTSQLEDVCRLKAEFLKDEHLADTIFHCREDVEHDWVSFSGTVDIWEAYTSKLWHKMVVILPKWIANQSIFYEPNGWVD
ncbi:hypothetical protein OSB04_008866 [Centaurea solstitialis]|uniref:Fe2OG dioxygenase domain-containing protein n=1 Tax=Centaurea solstitialis TaxID=347529 RepID=A0AA38WU41_9ASTR|nr:hypothetical protein OSB04_008866 [Centaurea solstitialis]